VALTAFDPDRGVGVMGGAFLDAGHIDVLRFGRLAIQRDLAGDVRGRERRKPTDRQGGDCDTELHFFSFVKNSTKYPTKQLKVAKF